MDWRGPHERQGPGRIAPAGHAGPLTVLPGSWGGAQTGVSDNVPSATDDLMLWLHALDVRGSGGEAAASRAVELAPLAGEGLGRTVVLAAHHRLPRRLFTPALGPAATPATLRATG